VLLFVLMFLGCLTAVMPLGIATAVKVKRVGSILGGFLSLAIAAVCGYFFCGLFLLAEISLALPAVVFGGTALLCAIWAVFLFATADEHN
jgi:hypothetical protein